MATTHDFFRYESLSLSQEQVFLDILYDVDQNDGEVTKEQTVFYLETLYSPEIKGDRFFYTQDEQGLPLHRVETRIGNTEFFCKLLDCNQFNSVSWHFTQRPAHFVGVWPPREPADLLALQKGKCSRRKLVSWDDPGN